MKHDEARRYHDRALAYLHGSRHGFRAANPVHTALKDEEAHIAIAIEGNGDTRRMALRVRKLDKETLQTIKMMRSLGHLPTDITVEEIGELVGHGAQDAVTPIQPGVACANQLGPRGTLGCFLDRAGKKLILSASHILAIE